MMAEYVQLLTVVKPRDDDSQSRVLLCHWSAGDFKGRFTGLWGKYDRREEIDVISTFNHLIAVYGSPEYPAVLENEDLQLVAKFEFDVPEKNTEYVFLREVEMSRLTTCDSVTEPESSRASFKCQCFSSDEIPFDQMPQDDKLWYPGVLRGEKYVGYFNFAGEPKYTIKSWRLEEVGDETLVFGGTAC